MRKNHLNNAKTNAKTQKMHQHLQSINLKLFLVVELRFFSAHILRLRFFPEMCVKNAKRRPKIITKHEYV